MPRSKKAAGRPPRHEGERLSKNRTFRVRGNLDDQLQAAAAASGRSVSEEIEHRLEQSFDQTSKSLIEVLTGREALRCRGLLISIAAVLQAAGGDSAFEGDHTNARTMAEAINKVVAVYIGELFPLENSFPERNETGSADQLAWASVVIGRRFLMAERIRASEAQKQ